jgi:hypothetical protein
MLINCKFVYIYCYYYSDKVGSEITTSGTGSGKGRTRRVQAQGCIMPEPRLGSRWIDLMNMNRLCAGAGVGAAMAGDFEWGMRGAS